MMTNTPFNSNQEVESEQLGGGDVNDAFPGDAEADDDDFDDDNLDLLNDDPFDDDFDDDDDDDDDIAASEPKPGDPDFEGGHVSGEDDIAFHGGIDIKTNEDVQEHRVSKEDAPVEVGQIWMTQEQANPMLAYGGAWQVVLPVFWKRIT